MHTLSKKSFCVPQTYFFSTKLSEECYPQGHYPNNRSLFRKHISFQLSNMKNANPQGHYPKNRYVFNKDISFQLSDLKNVTPKHTAFGAPCIPIPIFL